MNGEDGILSWEAVQSAIRPSLYYRPKTALVSLENTHNMAGGTVYPVEVANEICDRSHDAGLPVHLDGARVFNAATYLGKPRREITCKFDSIQFCLSKGLGAPVGSMIVGSREFIERCRSDSQNARRRHAAGRRVGGSWSGRAGGRSEAIIDGSRQREVSGESSGGDFRALRSIRQRFKPTS